LSVIRQTATPSERLTRHLLKSSTRKLPKFLLASGEDRLCPGTALKGPSRAVQKGRPRRLPLLHHQIKDGTQQKKAVCPDQISATKLGQCWARENFRSRHERMFSSLIRRRKHSWAKARNSQNLSRLPSTNDWSFFSANVDDSLYSATCCSRTEFSA